MSHEKSWENLQAWDSRKKDLEMQGGCDRNIQGERTSLEGGGLHHIGSGWSVEVLLLYYKCHKKTWMWANSFIFFNIFLGLLWGKTSEKVALSAVGAPELPTDTPQDRACLFMFISVGRVGRFS